MSVKSACLCQNGTFAGGRGTFTASKRERRHGRRERFSCQKDACADGSGAVSAWNDAVIYEKGPFCDRRALSLVGWAPYMLKWMPQWVERAFFVPAESLNSRKVAISA